MIKSRGFTVTELMIATAVFAVVLLLAQASFLQIGRLFYRGVSLSNTQETADHILQDVSGSFQNAVIINPGSSGNYTYYCIGNTRYTYKIDNEISTDATPDHSATTGNYGILKDTLPGSGGACNMPCDDTSSDACPPNSKKLHNPIEMLSDKMRVEEFDIKPSAPTSSLYNISIVVAYGDTNTLEYASPGVLSSVRCQGSSYNSFCAVARVSTAVYQGFRP